MTLMLLWEEYVAAHPGQPTYRYSQFCERYRRYALRLKRSMRQTQRAGEKLCVDYADPTVELANTGRAHIFVAALGASSYTFACATPRETMADWLEGCARALRFFGGVPQLIVPDNPRAMIASPNRYEPRANETVEDFARHYGTSVLPARPRHPQDKAKVESAVQVVERWILMRLRHRRFASVDEVNDAIEPLLQSLNNKSFQKLPGSRASAFADLDAPALQALPLQPWEWAVFKSVRVHIDHHVEINGHRYSVPQNLVGLMLEARITARAVELLHPRPACGIASAQRAQGRLYDSRSPPAGGTSRSPAMDARAIDPLGAEHRRCHRPPSGATDRGAASPRAWLQGMPRTAVAGTPLWQGTAGGSQPDRPGAGHGEVRARESHSGQRARQDCREHGAELDQPAS